MATKKASNKQAANKVAETTPLLDEILEHTRLAPKDEGYDVAKRGIAVLLQDLLSQDATTERVDKRLVDEKIKKLDERLSDQMDQIVQHPEFQQIESAWRGLEFLLDRTDMRENIIIEILNASKQDLDEDFKDAPDITASGLYHHIYTSEYGQFGGKPYGCVIGNYEFTPKKPDVDLLTNMAKMSAMTHAPFISSAGKEFFGVEDFNEIAQLKELDSIFEGAQYQHWHAFRELDVSRNVGLTMPKFLLRHSYGEENPVRNFNYQETTGGKKENYLWGNASFAFATRLTESFASYRWCPNIIGPRSGGAVEDLPHDVTDQDGQDVTCGPVEVQISDRREYELSELGFIPLTLRKSTNNATFFSASSTQKPKYFGTDDEAKQSELNFRLGTQLPYLFIVNRLAHYVKVLQRENLGSWKSRGDLETELNKWLRQYVADQENPSPATRSQRPLRRAKLEVREVEGEAGWYKVDLQITPHFKFMGANFTLSLSGMLDRA